ncbi:hypothetical protein GCM10009575_099380 [Streptomyces rhizosphaericus]|uniref:Transposase n=1 Tax=Streptomyces rhizosphaericus TaxID=114699 RepID=A0ABP4CBT4_9ACTN
MYLQGQREMSPSFYPKESDARLENKRLQLQKGMNLVQSLNF